MIADLLAWAAIGIYVAIAGSIVYLHEPLRPKMDVADLFARYGIAACLLSVAVGSILFVFDIPPYARLPLLVFTGLITLIGLGRDVHREARRRRGGR